MKPTHSKPTSRKPSTSIRSRTTKSLLINLDDIADPLVALPPDGGWGWVVTAAGFLSTFLLDGIVYCFAVFLEDISNDLNVRITEVATANSVLSGFYYLAGPVTCAAINRFGFRIIAVAGGFVAAAAFVCASFLNTLTPFVIIIGVVGGTGFNLIYTPSVIVVGFYFERWRALAMALLTCGSSLGVIAFPMFMTHLLYTLNWRNKFRVVAGFCIICSLLALTYKPIKTTKVEKNVQFGEVSRVASISSAETETEIPVAGGLEALFQRFKNALFPTYSQVSFYSSRTDSRYPSKTSGLMTGFIMHRRDTIDPEAISTYMHCENSDLDNTDAKSGLYPVPEVDSEEEVKGCCKKCCSCRRFCGRFCKRKNTSFSNINRPMYRDDIFYAGSVFVLPQYQRESHQSTGTAQRRAPSLAYTLSVSRAATQRDLMQQNQCVCCPEAFVRIMVTMLHFQMFKSPTFVIILISGFLSLMGMYCPYMYVAKRAQNHGIEEQTAMMLLSVIGISNAIGRALCGVVSFFPVIDINVLTIITLIICGGITIASIFFVTMTSQIIYCSVFGFTIASFSALRAILLVELFGLENLTNCFGLNMLFQAAASFAGVPIASILYDATGDFQASFLFAGSAILLSAIMLIPIKRILKWELKRKRRVTFN